MKAGVSVIVCCHQSAPRLRPTIEHLLAQEGTVPWELVLVDNRCTDQTVELARSLWSRAEVPLTIVREDTPGLTAARMAGIAASSYGVFSFVDDDNWVAPDWISTAFHALDVRPRVGAVGSYNEGVFEVAKPEWIDPWLHALAVGAQLDEHGRVRPGLFGAGLSVRRAAWDDLAASGFRFRTTDRVGKSLVSGGDFELCAALVGRGWELHYEPRLRLQHFMPAGRLEWDYMRRLHRGFGATSVCFDAARDVGPLRRTWIYRFGRAVEQLVRRTPRAVPALLVGRAGDSNVIGLEMTVGRLMALVRSFGQDSRPAK